MKDRLVKFETMFSTAGWSQVVQWAKQSAEEQRDRMLFCQNWEQYVNLQAQWTMFTEFASLEEATLAEFERIAQEHREQIEAQDLLNSELDFE
jgi:hypothetical protein